MQCSNCNSPTPPNARFCPNCGQPLTAEAVSAAQTAGNFNLDRFLPRELAAKLKASHASGGMRGERRIITMLFCDVTGSTAAAEQLDPEEWTEIINGAFEHMIRPIYKYEGIVARLMGDAILAFFGAPIAHEDDPQRAVLAGLEIQKSILPYAEEIRNRFDVSFALRVGINTGLVVVGNVGSDLRMEYTAIGDAINLAARMEQTAAPGSVQIADETYKLVAPFFEFEALGGIEVKGKSEPVNSYRVLSVKATPGQLRGLQGVSSPLVGRQAEMSALEKYFAALNEGTGAVVTVLGEAGLGKSSLIAAAHHNLNSTSIAWIESHALSYTQSNSYYSWRRIFRQIIGAHESDTPTEVRVRLWDTNKRFELPQDELPFLEALLAVESQESLQKITDYQGEARLQRVTKAARSCLCAVARESPLALIFDDLHWIDEASLVLLSGLIELAKDHPVLFIIIMRPDQDAPAWDFNQRIQLDPGVSSHQIELQPFSNEITNTLLLNLLGTENLPEALFNRIIEKAEGNPFFVEEIIRSLIETDQIVYQNGGWHQIGKSTRISLPTTLSGVLSARIDRLPEESKQILHYASVIGREFDLNILSTMSEHAPNLDLHIQKLVEAGLFQPVEENSKLEYTFRHVLIQEAAYNSILLKRRRALHARVGEILEALYADRLNEFAPLLAHHFYIANDPRSLRFDQIAGESALHLYANAEAVTHFSHALKTARSLKAPHEQIHELYTKLGQALELSGRFEEALNNYNAMEEYALELDVPSIQLAALLAKSTLYSTYTTLHDSELSEQTIQKALALSKELDDRDVQVKLHWNLMLTYLFSKRLDRALLHSEQALPLARELDDPETLAFVLNDLGRLYSSLGETEKAYAVIQEARKLWERLENQSMLADSYGAEASVRLQAGDLEETIQLANRGLHISEKIENLWGQSYNRMFISSVALDRGEIGRTIQLATESVSEGDRGGLIASSTILRAELGWVYGYYGSLPKAFELAEQALKITKEKQPGFRNLPLAILVRLHLLNHDIQKAQQLTGTTSLQPISIPLPRYVIVVKLANVELALATHAYQRALELADDLLTEVSPLTRIDIPMVLQRKAETLIGLEQIEEAHQVLTQACSLAEEMGSKHHLWSIYIDLAGILIRLDQPEQADIYRQKAREIVEEIAEGLEVLDLSQSFLMQPRVRDLMRK